MPPVYMTGGPLPLLTGIPDRKRIQAIECLDELLTFKDDKYKPSPIISGYNWYATIPQSDSIVTFSNIHETEAYQRNMLSDLEKIGYPQSEVMKRIREKAGAFLHKPKFRICDNNGNLLPGLRVKDTRTGEYLDLNQFALPLVNYPAFKSADYLVAEDKGWELDMPFSCKDDLFRLVSLFLKKSGLNLYDSDGTVVPETDEEREIRSPWADAYETPVLLLGKTASRYAAELPQFTTATKIFLVENSNEISFIIHERLDALRRMHQYELLQSLGFKEEVCLGNKPFILEYVDKKG